MQNIFEHIYAIGTYTREAVPHLHTHTRARVKSEAMANNINGSFRTVRMRMGNIYI